MTAKEYLSQAYMIDRRININLKKLEQMRMALYGKGVCYESDGSKKEHNGNGTESAILKVMEYSEDISAQTDKLITTRIEIDKAIKAVTDDTQREVLERRYLLYEKWERIAVDMAIDLRWVYRIHKKALFQIIPPLKATIEV